MITITLKNHGGGCKKRQVASSTTLTVPETEKLLEIIRDEPKLQDLYQKIMQVTKK